MKFHYHPEADSLYIDLANRASAESTEVAEGVVLDFDAVGRLVGIDIDHASQVVDLSKLEAEEAPARKVGSSLGSSLRWVRKSRPSPTPSRRNSVGRLCLTP